MKRRVGAFVLATALGGCMSSNPAPGPNTAPTVRAASDDYRVHKVPGVVGPWGEPIPMQAPYTSAPPRTAAQAHSMMYQSVPLSFVQMGQGVMPASAQMPGMGMPPGGMPMMPPAGMMAPPGVPFGPAMMPPGGGMMPPGMPMPGMMPGAQKGKGPGVMQAAYGPPPGAVAAVGAMSGPPGRGYTGRTQIRFTGPEGTRIAWLTQGADGKPTYSGAVVEAPGRYNFAQAAIYRLKLNGIRGRPGLEVYPTLEVVPANPKTDAFLAHSAVPLEFTAEDFQEVTEGKYLVKVIYLPDPRYQELAATGTDMIISTRLEPGADPILEAQRRGSILLVIRMGNVDQEAPNTPPLDCTSPAPSSPGMTPPGIMPTPHSPPGPVSPAPAPPPSPSASLPPSLRAGRSLPAPPPTLNPGPAMPPLPGIPSLPTGPGLGGATSKLSDASPIRQASAVQVLPDLPPRPPSSLVPVLPPPPTPAELTIQGSKK